METEETKIQLASALGAEVAQQAEALESAITAEQQAEAAILARVLESVGDRALTAIASRPKIAYEITGHADVNRQREKTTHAAWRGVLLSCEPKEAGPIEDNPRDNTGQYVGSDLFLCVDDDGYAFVELRYSGFWSRWQGSAWEWSATEHEMTVAEVAEEYDLDVLLVNLLAALRRYVTGNASKRAEQARARTLKLEALLALL